MKSHLLLSAVFIFQFLFPSRSTALEDALAAPILAGLRQAGYQVEMCPPVNISTIVALSREDVRIELSLYQMPTLEKARYASSHSTPMVAQGIYSLVSNRANSVWVHRRYLGGNKQLLVFYAKAESEDLLADHTKELKELFAALKPLLPSVNSVSTEHNRPLEPAALDVIRAPLSRIGFTVAVDPDDKSASRLRLTKGDTAVELSLARTDSPQAAREQSEIVQPMEDSVKLLEATRGLFLWAHPELLGAQKGSVVIKMKSIAGPEPELLRQIFDLIAPLLP